MATELAEVELGFILSVGLGRRGQSGVQIYHLPDVEESSHFTDEVSAVPRASQKQSELESRGSEVNFPAIPSTLPRTYLSLLSLSPAEPFQHLPYISLPQIGHLEATTPPALGTTQYKMVPS